MKKIEKEKKCPSSEGHLFCKGGRLCFCTFPYRSALCSFHRDWLLTECGHLEIFLKVVYQETNQTITLAVDPDDSIANLKSIINAKKGFPVDEQGIVYNGRELEDDRTVSDYNIPNKSTLNLVFRVNAVEIFVKMSTGIDVRFKLIKSNTIKNVKERIQLSQDIPCDMQRLHYLRRLLEDKYTLSDYSIKNGSVLDCNVLLISINVKMPNKDDISVDVCPEDKVRIVIDKIQARVAIPSDHQCLMYDGIKLVHGRILRDYQIRNGSILNLVKS
ncbi:unnamed protein product, partial [Porites lobata]